MDISKRTSSTALVAVVVIFLALSLSSLFTVRPQADEGGYANPAYNLSYNGTMSSNFLGHLPKRAGVRLSRHMYEQTPLYFILAAIWYKIVRFGLHKPVCYRYCLVLLPSFPGSSLAGVCPDRQVLDAWLLA